MLPVYHALEYRPDAIMSLFAPIARHPWAMLLHSGHADHQDNRFDIMVADPCITLTTRGTQTEICYSDQKTVSERDPLLLVQEQLSRSGLQAGISTDFPFQGGALGLFGYDLGRRFENMPVRAAPDLTTPDMAVGIYDWAIIADNHQQTLTLICHRDTRARLAWLDRFTPPTRTAFHLTQAWQSNMDRAAYGKKFAQIQAWLRSGDCYQVNLAQRFQATYQGDEWLAFCHLNQQNRAPFSAWLQLPDSLIMSLSPERFLALYGRHIHTRPIKGTLPRLKDPLADKQQVARLACSPKDRAENLMIVDLLRNDIGRVATPGSVRVPELFVVESFPAVHHLVSTITAELKTPLQASDLLRACFPGGSITGAPKIRAMEIIETLEPHRRNAWCGSIGYISVCGRMDTNITIRTLIAEHGVLYCSAGGAIVADSHEQAEYQETFDKLQRILPCLANVPEHV
ncbi:aminodeoxychorismate synthase component 1 [Enterobacteriaceae bacterium LUAb1]